MKDDNKYKVVDLSLFVSSNTTLLELQTLLFLFFSPKSALPNWGCALSKDAAYIWTFTVLFYTETEPSSNSPEKLIIIWF